MNRLISECLSNNNSLQYCILRRKFDSSAVCPLGTFGQNCTQSCSCVRGTCDPEDGSCMCPPGYHGDLCERPISQNCSCDKGAVCYQNTGQCRCTPGWTGLTCGRSCRDVSAIPGFFGANCSERYSELICFDSRLNCSLKHGGVERIQLIRWHFA